MPREPGCGQHFGDLQYFLINQKLFLKLASDMQQLQEQLVQTMPTLLHARRHLDMRLAFSTRRGPATPPHTLAHHRTSHDELHYGPHASTCRHALEWHVTETMFRFLSRGIRPPPRASQC
jgi:hypothetical protein